MPDNEQTEAAPQPMAEVVPLFQVKFKSGQGQQMTGASADAVRAEMVRIYGEDYEILSIEEIKPVEVK